MIVQAMTKDHKILFAGPVGAGKTTSIASLSDIPPVSTEQRASERSVAGKTQTTVALDYGEIDIGGGERVLLFGTPGQRRFSFMWPTLGQGAAGMILLINGEAEQPQADVATYLTGFADTVSSVPCVIAINRVAAATHFRSYHEAADGIQPGIPITTADPRSRREMLTVVRLLLAQIEAKALIRSRASH